MSTSIKHSILLLLIILLAASLRFVNLNWDRNFHLHPDERFLTMVANSMRLPSSFSAYLHPHLSTFNPRRLGYDFYVYGTFPVIFNKLLALAFNTDTYNGYTLQGRNLAALADLQDELGDRQIAVARELTKLHEEIYRGRISAARTYFDQHPPRGEITLVVAGHAQEAARWTAARVQEALKEGLVDAEPPSSLARQVAAQSGWKRRVVYQMLTEMSKDLTEDLV